MNTETIYAIAAMTDEKLKDFHNMCKKFVERDEAYAQLAKDCSNASKEVASISEDLNEFIYGNDETCF